MSEKIQESQHVATKRKKLINEIKKKKANRQNSHKTENNKQYVNGKTFPVGKLM